jgi:2-polyprenyl-3-methyl-5-hydroxy-6-metoxy-1,4-benzoquinol methylase
LVCVCVSATEGIDDESRNNCLAWNTSREAWQTAARTIKNLRQILKAAAHTTSNPFTAQATMRDWEQAIQGAAAHYHANPNPESWDALAKTIMQQDPKLGLHRTRHDWILAQTANDNAILDLGANGGLLSQHLLEQRHNIAELVLVDQNEGALIKAKYRIERLHTQTPVRFLLSNLIYCDPRYRPQCATGTRAHDP